MKVLGRILLVLVALVGLIGIVVYVDGATLPVDHSTTVADVIPAPPDAVFARIADVAHGSAWRPAVKAVSMLAPESGRDHWIEDLGHGTTMRFLAVRSEAPVRRDVLLDDPGAAYGGTWIYELSPGPDAGTTTLKITETGFIRPPVYRFMMAHIFGLRRNLEQYESDMKSSFAGHR